LAPGQNTIDRNALAPGAGIWQAGGGLSEPGEQADEHSSSHIRLAPGWVWRDQQGNAAVGIVEKTTPDPEDLSIPWTLFRVERPVDRGILSGIRYIQLVNTHAGGPPAKPPKRAGEITKVPFYAQYLLYR
jgi:hypothetical protein